MSRLIGDDGRKALGHTGKDMEMCVATTAKDPMSAVMRAAVIKKEFGVTNRNQFQERNGVCICEACSSKQSYVYCPGRKYLFHGKKEVTVFHCGTRTCRVKPK